MLHGLKGRRVERTNHCRRSLEVKLPTIWTDEKQRWEESEKRREERREEREEKRREEKSRAEDRRGEEEKRKRREEKRRDETRREERRGEEKRREEKRKSQKKESEEKVRRKSHKKEDPGARKGRKVAKHCVFQWFVAPEGRKVGSLKRRVRSQMRDEKLHAVVARSTFRS